MKIWVDAQLSPAIAAWLNRTFEDITAASLHSLDLRDAIDYDIFTKARLENAIIMSKDDDFIQLIEKYGSPPKLLWITCGNTSNARLKEVLSLTLKKALTLLEKGENIVEISDKTSY